MAMNLLHRFYCSSDRWARTVEHKLLPWVLRDVELGDATLEIGPGYGANMRVLADKTALTAVEIDDTLAQQLDRKYGNRAQIITGDGTNTGLPAGDFSSVVCFTILHHVPTPSLQDQLFAEAFRVLERGGVFAGSDGVPSVLFRLSHIADTYNPVDPDTLPDRLRHTGFTDVRVDVARGQQRWRAVKPG